MNFKQWLEDTTSSQGQLGNTTDPEENGLKRISFLRWPVPPSEKADKLFGRKYMFRSDSDIPGQLPTTLKGRGLPSNSKPFPVQVEAFG